MSHRRDDDLDAVSLEEPPATKEEKAFIGNTVRTARQIYENVSATGSRIVSSGRKAAVKRLGKIQSTLGEDYQRIFASNPLIINSLAQAPLLAENKELLSTALNVPWRTAMLWVASTGTTISYQYPIGRVLGGLFHYGPRHVQYWTEINQYLDSVDGAGYRPKSGHSIDFLPQIVERFGVEGVPAFFCRLIQDISSGSGLPAEPNAWTIKRNLKIAGIAPKTAAQLISLSASDLLAGMTIASTIWKIWEQLERDRRKRKLLSSAALAAINRDYTGAIENYKRALELERSAVTLIALGEVYLRRAVTRPYAHRAFVEAAHMLATNLDRTISYYGAQLSLRGLAGLQALATADVIGDRFPRYWREQVDDLVNATVYSFASTAANLEREARPRVANPLVSPPLFSAAINRYLAAQTACQYPLFEGREELVTGHMKSALALLGRVAQEDESSYREPARRLREVWVRTVLPEDEADLLLATA